MLACQRAEGRHSWQRRQLLQTNRRKNRMLCQDIYKKFSITGLWNLRQEVDEMRAVSLWWDAYDISSVQSLSRVWLFATPWIVARQASLSITIFLNSIYMCSGQFSSVQLLNHVWWFATPWITAHQASLSITSSRSSPKLMSIKSVMPSSHLILCHPLLLLPPIPPSIKVFSNESTLRMRWPKYWSFSFSIIPSKKIPGLISFRMDWLDFLAVQGALKSLLQHHSTPKC